jgi:hypothetical protein
LAGSRLAARKVAGSLGSAVMYVMYQRKHVGVE